jgi:hypothetical protein
MAAVLMESFVLFSNFGSCQTVAFGLLWRAKKFGV